MLVLSAVFYVRARLSRNHELHQRILSLSYPPNSTRDLHSTRLNLRLRASVRYTARKAHVSDSPTAKDGGTVALATSHS
ncbi:hypothetical protein E2C01_004011 [Portunus trituberculatus]|uniref:Uncharacterized protein n=1 Tax=Portunus trituberculatus TaxID=210409 RepID=A0A5B7CQD8_PORTR|nr:hypothetical protein [Portunus trituberculatus]